MLCAKASSFATDTFFHAHDRHLHSTFSTTEIGFVRYRVEDVVVTVRLARHLSFEPYLLHNELLRDLDQTLLTMLSSIVLHIRWPPAVSKTNSYLQNHRIHQQIAHGPVSGAAYSNSAHPETKWQDRDAWTAIYTFTRRVLEKLLRNDDAKNDLQEKENEPKKKSALHARFHTTQATRRRESSPESLWCWTQTEKHSILRGA